MGLGHGANLIAYALPVLRLLGVRLVEVPPGEVNPCREEPPLDCAPPPPCGLPEGLNAMLRQSRRDTTSVMGSIFIDVAEETYTCEDGAPPEAIPSPPENDELAPDRALGELLLALDKDEMGHLLLADWLEEWLGPCPQAAALRLSRPWPGPLAAGERLGYHSFGWRWLDRDAVLYLAGVLRHGGPARRMVRAGFVIGLLYRRAGATSRWVRWVPPEAEEGSRPLARELGVDVVE